MSTTITDSEKVKMLAPRLRFKGFMDGWVCKDLGDVADIIMGQSPDGDSYNVIGNGVPLINGPVEFTLKHPVKIKWTTKPTKYCKANDILFCVRGSTTGRMNISNDVYCIGRGVAAIRAISNISTTNFIEFLLIENLPKILNLTSGSTFLNLDSKSLREFPFNFPILPEQQKIASFLSAVDEKIQQLSRKKELLEQYKKGVMQQLFSGKLRFKDENGKAFPKWEEKRIWEISEKKSSNIAANAIAENVGDYKIYGATGFLKTVDFYREEEPYISIVKDGAGVGRTLLCDAKTSVLGTLDIIKPIINVDLYFLYSVLNNIDFVKYTKGSTIPHIYFKDYSTEKIQLPNLKEQKKIANYLSNIDSKIESVIKQITQTQIFKKGLLQQMFV